MDHRFGDTAVFGSSHWFNAGGETVYQEARGGYHVIDPTSYAASKWKKKHRKNCWI